MANASSQTAMARLYCRTKGNALMVIAIVTAPPTNKIMTAVLTMTPLPGALAAKVNGEVSGSSMTYGVIKPVSK
jgi:hypothetical protein